MKCISCNINPVIDFEDICEGKYCQDCLDIEQDMWLKESGERLK